MALILTLSLGECGSKNEGDGNTRPGWTPEPSLRLTKDEAIEQVKTYVRSQGGTITVPDAPYQESEEVRIPCSQLDRDTDPNKNDAFLAKCQPVTGAAGAPYGYKKETVRTTKCCKPRTIDLPQLGRWSADYSSSTNSWSVHLEFDLEMIEQVLSWMVEDDSGAVSER
jgi:hypothetical protein